MRMDIYVNYRGTCEQAFGFYQQHRRADLDARVKDLLLPVARHGGMELLPMSDEPGDPAAELLLVEAERLLAGAAIVHIDVHSHIRVPSLPSADCVVTASHKPPGNEA